MARMAPLRLWTGLVALGCGAILAAMTSANDYLARLPRTGSTHRAGLLGLPAKLLRDRLDRMARARGQRDRYDLFLPRASELCGRPLSCDYAVADLGAADGWMLRYSAPGLRKIAVDAGTRYAAEFAERGVEFHQCDISREPVPLASDSVDLILMLHVIEHIRDPSHLMSECVRALKRGGGLYVRTPNIKKIGHSFWDDYTHVRPYTPEALAGLAHASGFRTRALFSSSPPRISLDLVTNGRFRNVLFRGGWEIEGAFSLV